MFIIKLKIITGSGDIGVNWVSNYWLNRRNGFKSAPSVNKLLVLATPKLLLHQGILATQELKHILSVNKLARRPHCSKVLMQGNLFQRCTHFLHCSVLSLGGKVNTRRMVTAWHGIHFHKNNLWNILVIGNYYVNFQNYKN